MNKAQRTVLVAGLVVAVAMVVYPPWVAKSDARSYVKPITSYSTNLGYTEYRFLTSDAYIGHNNHVFTIDYFVLDLPRLFVQLLGAGLLTVAGYVLVGRRKAGQVEAAEPKDGPPSN